MSPVVQVKIDRGIAFTLHFETEMHVVCTLHGAVQFVSSQIKLHSVLEVLNNNNNNNCLT